MGRKICHLITRMIQGGAQENTLLTLEGLKRDTDWEIHLAYGPDQDGEGSLLDEARKLGVILDPLRHLCRNLNPIRDLNAWLELRDYFSKGKFDLVHTHSSKAGILGRIAARKAGVRRVVHTIHGLAFDEFQDWWRNQVYIRAERVAANHCDRIISVCDAMTEQALAEGIGSAKKMHTIYSGFSLEDYLAVKPKAADGRFVMGLVARMFPLKGHEDLMRLAPHVLAKWGDTSFLIVGDGPMHDLWEKWLRVNGKWKDRVILKGRVPMDQVPSQMAKMDLLLHLSWREGLARTIPQAMAAGVPVCVYDIGGAAELVKYGVTGWIVPPGDLDALMKALGEIRGDPVKVKNAMEQARENVRNQFDVKVMQEKILGVYRELGM